MAFSDPQSVTIDAIAVSLPRVSVNGAASIYAGTLSGATNLDGDVKLSASHSYGKRVRRVIRLDHQKIADDPMNQNVSLKVNSGVYLVVDSPVNGLYSAAELKLLVDGFLTHLSASSGAQVTKLLGGES